MTRPFPQARPAFRLPWWWPACLCLLFCAAPATANGWTQRHHVIPAWSLGVPGANAHRYTPAFGFGGLSTALRIRVHPRLSVNASHTWQRFRSETTGTAHLAEMSVTSPQQRRQDMHALGAALDVDLPGRSTLLPWFGLGTFALYSQRHSDQFAPPGLRIQRTRELWQWAFAPRVGLLIMMRRLPLSLTATSHIAPPFGDLPLTVLTLFQVGLAIPI